MNTSVRRILVVDDEAALLEVISAMLQSEGHQVEVARSGHEALSLLECSPFDLVITDFNMPFMKGDELATAVRHRRPDMRVILITGCPDMRGASAGPGLPCESILIKPFSFDRLRRTVESALPN